MLHPTTLTLRCSCGALRGTYAAHRSSSARGRCHCGDCQAYARWLGVPDVTDGNGGTEVIQSWPAQLVLTEGRERVRLLRLSPKGLHRWYAGCCRSPIANSFGSPAAPFLGVLTRSFDPAQAPELTALYGAGHGVQGRFAPGGCPPGVHPSASLGIVTAALGIVARGWWEGASRPHPFFDEAGKPLAEAQVLSAEERAALQ